MKAVITAVYYDTNKIKDNATHVSFKVDNKLHKAMLDLSKVKKIGKDILGATIEVVQKGKGFEIVEVIG